MPRGKYVVIEGHDGTGKSTQVSLLRETLKAKGIESVEFHEPGGTPIADEIRAVIKNGSLSRASTTNLLLFTAARHEIWKQAEEQLQAGVWIIAARNYFSTLAYQGYGEGLNIDLITSTTRQFTNQAYMQPDLAVILSLDDETERGKRIAKRGELKHPDTFESKGEEFQQKVKDGYITIAKDHGLPIISALQQPEMITEQIYSLLQNQQ